MHEKARRWRVVGAEKAKMAIIFSVSGEKFVPLKNCNARILYKSDEIFYHSRRGVGRHTWVGIDTLDTRTRWRSRDPLFRRRQDGRGIGHCTHSALSQYGIYGLHRGTEALGHHTRIFEDGKEHHR